ncbi:MAG: oxidoreductase [Burkholderiales bacterium]|nr:oxidoreductase [Burkholderiales bacterium]
MQRSSNETQSFWMSNSKPLPELNKLNANISVDVCIIGAGIAGLTTAYMLQKQGKSVAVLEAWDLASGETSRTTAHITAVLDDRFFNLEAKFGKDNAILAAQSHSAAIDQIEEIVKQENIDCDFERVDGYLVALSKDQLDDFKKEKQAVKEVGFADMKEYSVTPLTGTINMGETMQFPRQATFNITKYIEALAKSFQNIVGKIFTKNRVTEVQGGDNPSVQTEHGTSVDAKSIVVTTNSPVNDRYSMHTKQGAYRSYVVAFEIPKNSYPGFLLWDLDDPYHYVRIVRAEAFDLLVVGGEDHKTGQSTDIQECYEKLKQWAVQHFSILGPIKYQWSGQIMEPVDYLAFIGRNPGEKNVYIATGDSGHGMTHGTIAGILISDLICGKPNPWEKLYDPSRIPLSSGVEFAKENLNMAGCMVKGWVSSGEADNIQQIKNGEGAVLRSGFSKIAVYKDEKGEVYKCSAVCPHLGCIVQWNKGEKSWDCPCHGSRFDHKGQILNGPSAKPLTFLSNE